MKLPESQKPPPKNSALIRLLAKAQSKGGKVHEPSTEGLKKFEIGEGKKQLRGGSEANRVQVFAGGKT